MCHGTVRKVVVFHTVGDKLPVQCNPNYFGRNRILRKIDMVNVYCHEHTTDEGKDCHLGKPHNPAPHQRELFDAILEKSREELPAEYEVDPSNMSFKVIDEQRTTMVFVTCYEWDTGYRVKIKPHQDEFFQEVFRPLVGEIPIPDKVDTRFKWEAYRLPEDLKKSCDVCGKTIEGGNPILRIKNPHNVQAGDVIEEKFDVDRIDFRGCFECAHLENRKPQAERELNFNGQTGDFFADPDWLREL